MNKQSDYNPSWWCQIFQCDFPESGVHPLSLTRWDGIQVIYLCRLNSMNIHKSQLLKKHLNNDVFHRQPENKSRTMDQQYASSKPLGHKKYVEKIGIVGVWSPLPRLPSSKAPDWREERDQAGGRIGKHITNFAPLNQQTHPPSPLNPPRHPILPAGINVLKVDYNNHDSFVHALIGSGKLHSQKDIPESVLCVTGIKLQDWRITAKQRWELVQEMLKKAW